MVEAKKKTQLLCSRFRRCMNSGFEAKGEIVYEDVSEGVISEAVYEWAQTLWENEQT